MSSVARSIKSNIRYHFTKINENRDIIKTLDSLIDHAEKLDMYIEYVALGSRLMKKLAGEMSMLVDPEMTHGILIGSLSAYRDTALREVEVESITVKYLFNQEEWEQLQG